MLDFLTGSSILVYFFIFFGKILEVAVSTVRLVLINRGERIKGTIIAFFEVILWLVVTGTVLVGFQDDIIKCIVFAAAFAIGNYFGSWIEEKLAFGLCSIQVIVPECEGSQTLISTLRENNFAVTCLKGKGKDGERELLILHIKRKRIKQAVDIINNTSEKALIVVNDSKVIRGGYIRK